MKTWNYRVIRHDEHDDDIYYAVHTVYYNESGEITKWSTDPEPVLVTEGADSVSGLLSMMLMGTLKPVLRIMDKKLVPV